MSTIKAALLSANLRFHNHKRLPTACFAFAALVLFISLGCGGGSTNAAPNGSNTPPSTPPATPNANSVCTPSGLPSTSTCDGPAELPRVYIDTTFPTQSGQVTTVSAGGDLQGAINAANCGDTIQLQAGATFTGSFTLPAKNCDSYHWIMIRTTTPDSSLPPPGTRITPCYAGVASLPGRPALKCTSTQNVMAQIAYNSTGNGPIEFANGANYYWLMGLEITRNAQTGPVYDLVGPEQDATFDHIVLDRDWLHGTAQDETARGLFTVGGTYIAVVDSFFTDFHCIAVSGACVDSQAISGGLGSNAMGPYKIDDNFLEAAGENVLFGGGAATVSPTDIEVRFNHFFKPLIWMKGQPGFVGGADGNAFVVKNHFELKNAQRVLYEGNVAENVWGGFSQYGYTLLLTPKNQAGANGTNVCPMCQVTDITVRYSTFSHMGSGFEIGNGASDNGGVPLDGERFSIHDITVDDVNPTAYNGQGGYLLDVGDSAGAPTLQHVNINHITGFDVAALMTLGAATTNPSKISDFSLTNNIVDAGVAQIVSSGPWGGTNCATGQGSPLAMFNACFVNYNVTSNAIIGGQGSWPSGNFFPSDPAAVQFTNYNNGNGGNYTLLPSSPYHNAGTDGKDLGADTCTTAGATNGVR